MIVKDHNEVALLLHEKIQIILERIKNDCESDSFQFDWFSNMITSSAFEIQVDTENKEDCSNNWDDEFVKAWRDLLMTHQQWKDRPQRYIERKSPLWLETRKSDPSLLAKPPTDPKQLFCYYLTTIEAWRWYPNEEMKREPPIDHSQIPLSWNEKCGGGLFAISPQDIELKCNLTSVDGVATVRFFLGGGFDF